MQKGVIIVGAGYAGDCIAAGLRQLGWTKPVTIVGEESAFPYDRPPLSKTFLKGTVEANDLALRPSGFYEQQGIEVLRCMSAIAIDRDEKRLRLSTGTSVEYDCLVLATGSKHRPLNIPGATHPSVLHLRSLSDAENIKRAVKAGSRLAIIGGGFVGLEVAASMKAIGAQAVVIEREARLLGRVASAHLSQKVQSLHEANGTEIHLGVDVEALHHGVGVRLKNGRDIACDAVLVGIGALANDGLAVEAGLACDDGVIVDQYCRSSDPQIFAIGDCSRRDVPGFGHALRLESIPSAQEQARTAAAAIVGAPLPESNAPWFWSDQFESRIQIAGIRQSADRVVVRCESDHTFAAFHLDDQNLVRAVEALNNPAEFMLGKMLIKSGVSISNEMERASAIDLRNASLEASNRKH